MKEWPWAGPSDKLINEDSKSNEQLGTCTTWPRITIVTPSLNQGSFIEQSIRSVLLQGYPNLEYFIIDGGSSDETVDLIRKYEPYLAGWVSEHDKGQSNALAKGFANATGDYLGWINADDIYLPGALFAVGHAARRFGNSIIAGNVANMHVESGMQVIISQQNIRLKELLKPWKNSSRYHQPGIFFPRRYYQRIGGINESLRYAMDYDLYCRLLMIPIPVKYIDQVLAQFRLHKSSKTVAENTQLALEVYSTAQQYWYISGESKWSCNCHILLHFLLRSAKCLLCGKVNEAARSIVGGVRLMNNSLPMRPE